MELDIVKVFADPPPVLIGILLCAVTVIGWRFVLRVRRPGADRVALGIGGPRHRE